MASDEDEIFQCGKKMHMVKEGVTEAAHDAIVHIVRGAVMSAVHFTGQKEAHVLQSENKEGDIFFFGVNPSVELLAINNESSEKGKEGVEVGVTGQEEERGEEEGGRAGLAVDIVSKLASCNNPRPLVVALEGINVGAKNGGVCIPIIIDAPVI